MALLSFVNHHRRHRCHRPRFPAPLFTGDVWRDTKRRPASGIRPRWASLIPQMLHRVRIDPAESSGVFVTTVTDVVSYGSFLGIATVRFGLG
jgi:hypothetical protein